MNARSYMARKLREARLNSGMTQAEVANKLGKSPKTISAWEVGKLSQPDADQLVRLCVLYNVGISYFFDPKYS